MASLSRLWEVRNRRLNIYPNSRISKCLVVGDWLRRMLDQMPLIWKLLPLRLKEDIFWMVTNVGLEMAIKTLSLFGPEIVKLKKLMLLLFTTTLRDSHQFPSRTSCLFVSFKIVTSPWIMCSFLKRTNYKKPKILLQEQIIFLNIQDVLFLGSLSESVKVFTTTLSNTSPKGTNSKFL